MRSTRFLQFPRPAGVAALAALAAGVLSASAFAHEAA
jgi:hypothetical protein